MKKEFLDLGKQPIANGFLNKGTHSFNWNAANYATGLYIIKLAQGNDVLTQKIMLIK